MINIFSGHVEGTLYVLGFLGLTPDQRDGHSFLKEQNFREWTKFVVQEKTNYGQTKLIVQRNNKSFGLVKNYFRKKLVFLTDIFY